MSENHSEPTQSTPSSSAPVPVDAVPKLQKETVVMVNDRGRLGLLIALCSLAGVAVGFGLSNMAVGLHSQHCSIRGATSAIQIAAPARMDTPAWLGVRIKDHAGQGAYILSVEPNSPAKSAGFLPGDVVVGFAPGGSDTIRDVTRATDLVRLVQSADVGDYALIVIERKGSKMKMRSTLEHMPLPIYHAVYGR